jgi:membrane protease YdiL (CAAX protease family)
MKENEDVESHSILRSITLSLVPGFLIFLFFILFAPIANHYALPSLLVLFVAFSLVLVPFELGYLFLQGKKLNGCFSLKGIVLFKDHIPIWQYFALVPLLLIWMVFCFVIIAVKIDRFFIDSFFGWLPNWFFIDNFSNNISQYSKNVLIIIAIFGFVFNGLIGPIVEEMYFRGYLLPRLKQLRAWAPLLNIFLFSLYHLFSPWQNITRILALLPLVYVVWWKHNIYIGIIVHCTLNTIGMIGIINFISKM